MGVTYNPDNDAQKPQEELDQSVLLTGNEFDIDNINAFPHLQDKTTGTYFYVHIYPYEETKNTHACMDNMMSQFLSESYNTKRMAITLNFPKMLKYTGAYSSKFKSNCTTLVKAYNEISKKGQD